MSGSLTVVDSADLRYQVPAGTTTEMYEVISKIEVEDLTSGSVDGDGVFDKLMTSVNAHLKGEYDKNRITGAAYTEAYIALTQAAMNTALQFLMNRETSFWASQQAQIAAVTGQIQLETQKAGYHTAVYNLQTTLPAQTLLLTAQKDLATVQKELAEVQVDTAEYNLATVLPLQSTKLLRESDQVLRQTELIDQQTQLAVAQKEVAARQVILVTEQTEVQRAQTMDTRMDESTAVAGVIGKQKALFTQQVSAYEQDSAVKSARPFVDAFITMKTIDEGLTPPTNFNNTSLDEVLQVLRTNMGL